MELTLGKPSLFEFLTTATCSGFDLLRLLDAMVSKYGAAIRLPTPFESILYFSDPRAAREVLVSKHRDFQKTHHIDNLRVALGNGLVTSEGETWKRDRKIIQKVFHAKSLEIMLTKMECELQAGLIQLERVAGNEQNIDITETVRSLTLDAITAALMGSSLGEDRMELIHHMQVMLEQANESPHMLSLLTRLFRAGKTRRTQKSLERINSLLFEIIEQRHTHPPEDSDFVGLLLAAVEENTLTNTDVRDQIATMFAAGHETSAISTLWALHLLQRHPEVETQLVEEIRAAVGNRIPTREDMADIPLANHIFREALRLFPPIWALARRAVESTTVAGVPVKKGQIVVLSILHLHRNPAVWNNPTKFNPHRFAAGNDVPKDGFIPFSLGPRSCIGERFASVEGPLLLAGLLSKFQFEWSDPKQRPKLATLLTPPQVGEVVIRRRPTH